MNRAKTVSPNRLERQSQVSEVCVIEPHNTNCVIVYVWKRNYNDQFQKCSEDFIYSVVSVEPSVSLFTRVTVCSGVVLLSLSVYVGILCIIIQTGSQE